MISAFVYLNDHEYIIDWPELSIDLFHQICRVIDLEGVEQEQTVFFSRRDFRKIRGWLTSFPHLSVSYIEPWIITVTIDGYVLKLKVKEDD